MALVKVSFSITKVDPNHADFNQNVQNLCIQAVVSGATVEYKGGNVLYNIHSENLPAATAKSLVSLGLDVLAYPFFIKMNPTDTVPAGVPNRLDGDGNAHTWNTWKLANYDIHTATNGDKYISGEANTGTEVLFNDFSTIYNDCYDAETWKAAMPSDP